jgi:large subunit ribosomal protein L9
MKVILLKQKRGLGKVGEIVTVKDGFGRNFLLPQGVAMRATAENEKKIEAQKADLEKQNAEIRKAAEVSSKKIEGKDFTFIRQCADDGRLFGSVSTKEIAKAVEAIASIEITHANVFLIHPIKSLGVYEVIISAHADVTCNILINVARSESEAKDAINEYRSGPKEETEVEEIAVEIEKEEGGGEAA